ncbi:hypothetical protein [Streptomyces sp. NPDC004435]|uniref:hypothetical protein n=1 Tax=Streptomyces sp. NPDC004435 TaxID=3364701 RepID=UPI0036C2FC6F
MASLDLFSPGDYTPAAGAYVCDCAEGHLWRIDMAGHVFPTFPPRCGARTWRTDQLAEVRDQDPEQIGPRPLP